MLERAKQRIEYALEEVEEAQASDPGDRDLGKIAGLLARALGTIDLFEVKRMRANRARRGMR